MGIRIRAFGDRPVRTIGLFSPTHWFGYRPDQSVRCWLYYCLKAIGFRETVWQIVFSGQIAGLVLPLDGGSKELHVRFYEEGVEAELEVGRYYLRHFSASRVQGESLLLKLLSPYLAADELALAKSCMREDPCEDVPHLLIRREELGPKFTVLAALSTTIVALIGLLGLVPLAVPWILSVATVLLWRTLRSTERTPSMPLLAARRAPEVGYD